MTVRPLLFHVVRKRLQRIRSGKYSQGKERDWKEGLSSSSVKTIDICIAGAKDVVNMMTIAAEKDLVGTSINDPLNLQDLTYAATYGYMDGEHVLSATIVLVMAYVAFPTNSSTTIALTAGLRLLQTMSERGNSHMGSRYELLSNMCSNLTPETIKAPHSDGLSSSIQTPLVNMPEVPALLSISDMLSKNMLEPLSFPMVDNAALGEIFYDENTSPGMDLGLWEEGFANPSIDAGFGFLEWSRAAGDVLQFEDMDMREI